MSRIYGLFTLGCRQKIYICLGKWYTVFVILLIWNMIIGV